MSRYGESNKYNATPRKVFDKAMDRQDLRLARHKEDHRKDIQAIFQRLINLENQLSLLNDHVEGHCHALQVDHETDPSDNKDDTEGL